ncbi:MAG: type II toxin-antitoxin system VapC family toxin [Bacillota bacterium]
MGIVIDTSVIIGFLRGHEPDKSCFAALLNTGEGVLTAVTLFELRVGLEQDSKKVRLIEKMYRLLGVLPFDMDAAVCAAEIEKQLRVHGQTIGTRDVFIAGICMANRIPIVTGNAAHFARIDGLRVFTPTQITQ